MPRTTPELVAEIVEVDPSIDLDIFIAMANRLVTVLLDGSDLDEEQLEYIERLLSAHKYKCLRDREATSESYGGQVSWSYQGAQGLGLNLTHYGQEAMLMDTTKTLAAYNEEITDPPAASSGAMIDFGSVEDEDDFPRD